MSNTPEPTREREVAESIYELFSDRSGYNPSIEQIMSEISTLTTPLRQRISELEKVLRLILDEKPELFEDGLDCDLADAGITKLTAAYAEGLSHGLQRAKDIAGRHLQTQNKDSHE